jgi:hypothetical protein
MRRFWRGGVALRIAAFVGIACASTLFGFGVSTARAEQNRPAVTLRIEAQLDLAALRDGIARELGQPVTFDPGGAGGTVVVRRDGTQMKVIFDAADGRHAERSLDVPGNPRDIEHEVVLLVGNLARDQTAGLFDGPPPPMAVPPSPAPAEPARVPPDRCNKEGTTIAAGVDFVPFAGVSSTTAGRSATRRFSLGVVGALSGGVRGFAVSSVLNIDLSQVCGGEFAGMANVTGGAVFGAQAAGAVNVATGDLRGAQVAGGFNVAGGVRRGAQLAGAVNISAGDTRGAQLAGGVNVSSGTVHGTQIAPVNVAAGDVHGAQIGVVNVTTGSADFVLGVINVIVGGRLLADAWILPETGLMMAGLKNGGAHYHYIYALGTRWDDTQHLWAALGLGAHVTLSERLFADLDLVSHTEILPKSDWQSIEQVRLVIGVEIMKKVALFGGPTFNVLYARNKAQSDAAPSYSALLRETSTAAVRAWPGAVLGAEFF